MSEVTSARIARIAGKILAIKTLKNLVVMDSEGRKIKWAEVRSLAASALTQAPDKNLQREFRKKSGAAKPRGRK